MALSRKLTGTKAELIEHLEELAGEARDSAKGASKDGALTLRGRADGLLAATRAVRDWEEAGTAPVTRGAGGSAGQQDGANAYAGHHS